MADRLLIRPPGVGTLGMSPEAFQEALAAGAEAEILPAPDFAELTQAEQAAVVRRLAAPGAPDDRSKGGTRTPVDLFRRAL
jgi:hypothetical protein